MTFLELVSKWEEPVAEGTGARRACAAELKDLICYWQADMTKQTTQGSIPRQFILKNVLGTQSVKGRLSMENRFGVMWEWDHERILDWAEYIYWQYHPLPFGWAILVAPEREAYNAGK